MNIQRSSVQQRVVADNVVAGHRSVPVILRALNGGERFMSEDNVEIRPAATAVVVRELDSGLSALLLRRNRKDKRGMGAWVFPGGKIETDDILSAGGDDEQAARLAAVRESEEEASITLAPEDLQMISHWTTPAHFGKPRFATWFYLVGVDSSRVRVDGYEIDHHIWVPPAEALEHHVSGEVELLPPTLVTLTELSHFQTLAEARGYYARREVPWVEPLLTDDNGKVCMLYCGDAGYETADPGLPGARNRCYLEGSYWRYESTALATLSG